MPLQTSPCCWIVILQELNPQVWMDLDYIRYLLGFEGIEVTFNSSGKWSVVLRSPCSFLHRENHNCKIHKSDRRARVCISYNPHNCWYKRTFLGEGDGTIIRFNRVGMDAFLREVKVDEHGKIREFPGFQDMMTIVEGAKQTAAEASAAGSAAPSMESEEPRPWVASGRKGGGTFYSMPNPCDGCAAPCCRHVVYPFQEPLTWSRFDYIRYILQFPVISMALTPAGWQLILERDCTFLDTAVNRCTLYGFPDRPRFCSFTNEYDCTKRKTFNRPPDSSFIRFNHGTFSQLMEMVEFNDDSELTRFPSAVDILERIFS